MNSATSEEERAEVKRAVEQRQALDGIITDAAITAYRIRSLHVADGFGEETRCVLCVQHGETEWPCLTVKALDPWRWNRDGVSFYDR